MATATLQRISPFLWFDSRAGEAAEYYCSIFKNSRVLHMSRYAEGSPYPAGSVMSATFQLEGIEFIALNGGPHFQFTPAVSFFIKCETQTEIDYFSEKLTAGGAQQPCGWVTDKFGLSWQVVPTVLEKLLGQSDREKAGRVMAAMMQMKKLDIRGLEQA